MLRRLSVLLVVAALFAGAVAVQVTAAEDAKGCEGLSDYRVAMFKIGRDYLEKIESEVPNWQQREATSYSTDEWRSISEAALEAQRAIKDLDPPTWAEAWHDLQIERWGMVEQMTKTVASDGIMAAIAFTDGLDSIEEKLKSATEDVGKACADFIDFERDWQSLDGEIDGTPVATPTD